MGEALFNHYGQGRIKAFSAGSHPVGNINPGALATLKRFGLQTEGYKSQSWKDFEDQTMDIVITVCDNAANESCPIYLAKAVHAHWGVSDPGHLKGTDEEIISAFDNTYQTLLLRVNKMLALPLETMPPEKLSTELNSIGKLTN